MQKASQRIITIWVVISAIAFVGVAFGVGRLWSRAQKTAIPYEIRLGSIINSTSIFSFTAPKSKSSNIVLGYVSSSDIPIKTSGNIKVLNEDGNVVYVSSFDSEAVVEANWLKKYGLKAYVLDWNSPDESKLSEKLQTGKKYDLHITIHGLESVQATLWLSYLQQWKDRPSSQ